MYFFIYFCSVAEPGDPSTVLAAMHALLMGGGGFNQSCFELCSVRFSCSSGSRFFRLVSRVFCVRCVVFDDSLKIVGRNSIHSCCSAAPSACCVVRTGPCLSVHDHLCGALFMICHRFNTRNKVVFVAKETAFFVSDVNYIVHRFFFVPSVHILGSFTQVLKGELDVFSVCSQNDGSVCGASWRVVASVGAVSVAVQRQSNSSVVSCGVSAL